MVHSKVRALKDGYSLLSISPRLALMYRALKRPGKGGRRDRIQCAYFGFDSEEKANEFVRFLREKFGEIRAGVRESDRLSECAFEVKVSEFDHLLTIVLQCAKQQQEQPVAA